MFDRAPARPRPRARRPPAGRRRGRRRQRERPHWRADDHHEHPRRDGAPRPRRRLAPGGALGRVRRSTPGRDHRAGAHDRVAAHRRRRGRGRGPVHVRVGRDRRHRGGVPIRDARLPRGSAARIRIDRGTDAVETVDQRARVRRPSHERGGEPDRPYGDRRGRPADGSGRGLSPRGRARRQPSSRRRALGRAPVAIEHEDPGAGYLVDTSSPTFAAAREALQGVFEHEVVEIGSGGSIPLVPVLADDVPGDRGPDVGSRRRHVELPLAQRERGSRRGRAHGAGRGGCSSCGSAGDQSRPTARLDP